MKRYTNHYDTAKMVIALFIVLVAFGIFLFLNSYSDVIYEGGNYNAFYVFATLATVVSGLLIGLLYVVNNSKASIKKSTKKRKQSRK
jgi:hypothetical protein